MVFPLHVCIAGSHGGGEENKWGVGRDWERDFAGWYVAYLHLYPYYLFISTEKTAILKQESLTLFGGETVVFLLTLFVRQQLAPVDLQELREARYGLKGA